MLLLLFNTTLMDPGPPSTGVAIAMDGGMADANLVQLHLSTRADFDLDLPRHSHYLRGYPYGL